MTSTPGAGLPSSSVTTPDDRHLVRERDIAEVDDGASRLGFLLDEGADLAGCAEGEVAVAGGERGRGEAAVAGRIERPLGPLRGDRVAELEAVEVEPDARPGDRFALRVEDAAADPGAWQEREPADVVVLAGEDADVVATLGARPGASAQTVTGLSNLRSGRRNRPSAPLAGGPEFLLVGNTPDHGPGDRTTLLVDHQAGHRAGLCRCAGGLLVLARPRTAQAIRANIVKIVTDRRDMGLNPPVSRVGKLTRHTNTVRQLSLAGPGIASLRLRSGGTDTFSALRSRR